MKIQGAELCNSSKGGCHFLQQRDPKYMGVGFVIHFWKKNRGSSNFRSWYINQIWYQFAMPISYNIPEMFCSTETMLTAQTGKIKKRASLSYHCNKIYRVEQVSWSEKFHLYFKNHNFCEYVKFGAISWKFCYLIIVWN